MTWTQPASWWSLTGFTVRVRMLAKRCGLQIGTLSAPMPDGWRNTVYCYSRETLALVKSFFMDRGSPGAMVSACAWQD